MEEIEIVAGPKKHESFTRCAEPPRGCWQMGCRSVSVAMRSLVNMSLIKVIYKRGNNAPSLAQALKAFAPTTWLNILLCSSNTFRRDQCPYGDSVTTACETDPKVV